MKTSALALEALLSKMRAGFNDNLVDVAQSVYGVIPFALEWPATIYSANTKTVILGQLHPDLVDEIGVTGLNRLLMFILNSSNKNYEKPNDFSGDINIGMDFHLEWKSSDPKQNFETFSLAVEDAFGETIQILSAQNWGGGVVYNGAFTCTRSPIVMPSEGQGSLRQMLMFRLGFQVDV